MENLKISKAVDELISNIEALNESTPIILGLVGTMASKFSVAYGKYLEKYGEVSSKEGDKTVYTIPVEKRSRVNKLRKQAESLRKASKLIPRNLLVSFVSEFDCFLGSLLKTIYTKRPELLNDSSKQITYSELLSFDHINEAKEQVLEKEIESILRKSHSDHFSILENKFDIKLRKGLEIWPDFIEITERRNLFVHANGIVSSQYLKVCVQNEVNVSSLSVGDQLVVNREYLKKSSKVIFEISVKLASVLWRKLFPDEREEADSHLNELCLDLISKGNNKLASCLLEFAIKLPKHHSDTIKRFMIINLAQAYKRSERKEKCEEILKRYDWSATSYNFKLAVSVLKEEYEESVKLLKVSVGADDLDEQEIIEWPLFREFRKTEEFLEVFKEIFDKDYALQEESMNQEFETHLDSIFKIDEEIEDANNEIESSSIDSDGHLNNIREVAEEVEREIDDELEAGLEKKNET